MSRSGKTIGLLCLIFVAASASADETLKAHDHHIESIAASFFSEHCIRCHGPSEAKGEMRLDDIDSDLSRPATFERWQTIVERIQTGEMPPEKEPQPRPEQVAEIVKQLTSRLNEVTADRRAEGRVVLRRLNRVEY